MTAVPNILWIVTTQWRAQACGYAGDPNARTPFLNAFAAAAVNYRQAVTPHPFGPFARAALLTGVASPQNGLRDYYDPLPMNARTIAHALRARGYATAFFGKWHLSSRDRAAPLVGDVHASAIVPPNSRGGFEFWEGFEGGFRLNDPFLHGTDLPAPVVFPGYQSDVLCERARGWTARSARWFCVVSLEPPHPPYDAPAAGMEPRPPGEIALGGNVPRGGAVEARAREELSGYYSHIEATDRAIGRLIESVSRDDTVVVFTSVHGDMHGAHGLFRKGWPHEESVRVPLLVGAPGMSPEINDTSVSLLDLASMTIRWAEGKPAGPLDAGSRISMPSIVAFPHQCDRAWNGIRTATRKLVLSSDGSPWLFFDIERDPFERENLALKPDRRSEIAALRARIEPEGI
ncbi:MAG: sulfatase-like hydrolase/transferase [Opitutaceae bacterium]